MPPPVILGLAADSSRWVAAYWPALAATGVISIAGIATLRRTQTFKEWFDRFRLALPIFGAIRSKTNLAFLAKTLGTLLRSGVTLVPALRISTEVLTSDILSRAMTQVCEDVKEGKPLATALRQSGKGTDLLVSFIEVGEHAGKLDEMLLHAASILEKDTRDQVANMMTLLSPAITIVIGLFVGGLILSVTQAILGINELAVR